MPKKWLYVIDEAVKKIESDELELGLQALQKVKEHGKALPEVMLYLAEVWYQLGHLADASAILTEVIRAQPDMEVPLRHEYSLLLAEIALDTGDFETAQNLLYDLKERDCDDIQLYLLLSDLYALQDLDEVAVNYLELAQQKEPENGTIMAALGDLYFRIGRVSEAMQMLERAGEENFDMLVFKGRSLAQIGDFEQAYQAYHQALEMERSPEILYGCSMMAFHLGKLEEAASFVESLLALDEDYVAAYPLASDIYLSLGRTDSAIKALQQYVALSGFDLDHIRRLIALLSQAGRYEEAKEYQKLHDQWNVEDEI